MGEAKFLSWLRRHRPRILRERTPETARIAEFAAGSSSRSWCALSFPCLLNRNATTEASLDRCAYWSHCMSPDGSEMGTKILQAGKATPLKAAQLRDM